MRLLFIFWLECLYVCGSWLESSLKRTRRAMRFPICLFHNGLGTTLAFGNESRVTSGMSSMSSSRHEVFTSDLALKLQSWQHRKTHVRSFSLKQDSDLRTLFMGTKNDPRLPRGSTVRHVVEDWGEVTTSRGSSLPRLGHHLFSGMVRVFRD